MRVWLVQRGYFKTRDIRAVTGIDSLIAYDYMGSTEFEVGLLGKSYRRIVAARSEFSSVDHTGIKARDGRALLLLCQDGKWSPTCGAVRFIADGSMRLKESAYMSDSLSRTVNEHGRNDAEFWWDIENDWMAWLGEKRTPLVLRAIEASAEKAGKK